MTRKAARLTRFLAVFAAGLIFAGSVAEARMGRGAFGSRGARTWSAPPPTNTAPGAAAPIQRSQTPQPAPGVNRAAPAAAAPAAAARQGRFGTGLMAGLLGAGLFGLLLGHGFFGGLAGLASLLGLALQIGLIVLLASFALRWLRARNEPALAQGHARDMGAGLSGAQPAPSAGSGVASSGASALGAALGSRRRPAASAVRDELGLVDADFQEFERSLIEMQEAYSRADVEKIWDMATPEMAGYIQEELNDLASRGEANRVTQVKLEQGDLAEAWREGEIDFATVAMRFSHTDAVIETATGRLVSGNPDRIVEATEAWTFRREKGGDWKLSAIQQF